MNLVTHVLEFQALASVVMRRFCIFFFTLNNVKIMIDPQIKYMSFFPLLM